MTKEKIKKKLNAIGLLKVAQNVHLHARNTKKKTYNLIFPTAVILLYHRVADVNDDPHELSVSINNFRNQLKYLKNNFTVMSLGELVNGLVNGKIKKKSVAITFDDGYYDNLANALPVLEEFNIPATFFITSGKIGSDTPFYWDKNVEIDDQGRPMRESELINLSKSKLVEIGAHTVNHPKLKNLKQEQQRQEIFGSKNMLEKLLNAEVVSFSYPFGDINSFNEDSIKITSEIGFKYACSNIHKRVKKNSNLFTLPRYVVRNWNLEEFIANMKRNI